MTFKEIAKRCADMCNNGKCPTHTGYISYCGLRYKVKCKNVTRHNWLAEMFFNEKLTEYLKKRFNKPDINSIEDSICNPDVDYQGRNEFP